jgi:RNA polymerase sigma factor (sigma-70 family)
VRLERPQKSPESSWAASRGFINAVEGQLPAAVGLLGREAVGYYCSTLVPVVRAAFLQEVGLYDENEKSFPEWLSTLIQNVVRERFASLIKDNALIDEELVRLATSGLQAAKNHLIHGWLPMIKNFVAATVHAHDVCPSSTDVDAFIEDVSQEVGLRLVENLDQFRFEQPFEHWVKVICYNTAYDLRRPITRRFGTGDVEYVSWEDLTLQDSTPVIRDPAHRRIVRELLREHGKKGTRARKSRDAIELSYFHNLEHKEVAKRLDASPGYVDQLFSHDYRKLREICREKYGLSGTDL